MEILRGSHDERMNIRPVVLGVCFLWGILCGFFFNVMRSAPVTTVVEPEKTTEREKPEPEPVKPPPERVAIEREDPPPSSTNAAENVTIKEDTTTEPLLEKIVPKAPPVGIDTRYGLSADTCVLPKMPEETAGKVPTIHKPVRRHGRLPPPELD